MFLGELSPLAVISNNTAKERVTATHTCVKQIFLSAWPWCVTGITPSDVLWVFYWFFTIVKRFRIDCTDRTFGLWEGSKQPFGSELRLHIQNLRDSTSGYIQY
jgi:hypothetical protein